MTPKAQKLLERMRQSKSDWKRKDLDQLYKGFGFVIIHGGSHDIVKHPDFPNLRAILPRHSYLAKGYVEYAIKIIDKLSELRKDISNENNASRKG